MPMEILKRKIRSLCLPQLLLITALLLMHVIINKGKGKAILTQYGAGG
jgi:hypothetical protein